VSFGVLGDSRLLRTIRRLLLLSCIFTLAFCLFALRLSFASWGRPNRICHSSWHFSAWSRAKLAEPAVVLSGCGGSYGWVIPRSPFQHCIVESPHSISVVWMQLWSSWPHVLLECLRTTQCITWGKLLDSIQLHLVSVLQLSECFGLHQQNHNQCHSFYVCESSISLCWGELKMQNQDTGQMNSMQEWKCERVTNSLQRFKVSAKHLNTRNGIECNLTKGNSKYILRCDYIHTLT
jgi:hypothetical protein